MIHTKNESSCGFVSFGTLSHKILAGLLDKPISPSQAPSWSSHIPWYILVALDSLERQSRPDSYSQWIGSRENLQENDMFKRKIHGFLSGFPETNPYQSIDIHPMYRCEHHCG